jgi:hypothetical protein
MLWETIPRDERKLQTIRYSPRRYASRRASAAMSKSNSSSCTNRQSESWLVGFARRLPECRFQRKAASRADLAFVTKRQSADHGLLGPSAGSCAGLHALPTQASFPYVVHDAAVRVKHPAGLEGVYREHATRLWRALIAYTGDPEVASDAVAEAFAQALRRGDALRAPERWVWTAAFPDRGERFEGTRTPGGTPSTATRRAI